jgi:hypothetical protein
MAKQKGAVLDPGETCAAASPKYATRTEYTTANRDRA